jgi:hypothetical protein
VCTLGLCELGGDVESSFGPFTCAEGSAVSAQRLKLAGGSATLGKDAGSIPAVRLGSQGGLQR